MHTSRHCRYTLTCFKFETVSGYPGSCNWISGF